MMKHAILAKILSAALTAGVLAASTIPVQAGEVWRRVENQQDRIAQGVHSGQLTYREYSRVDNGLDRINAQRIHDLKLNGGHLTPAEYRQLNRELNRESDAIYFDKHNRADQPGV